VDTGEEMRGMTGGLVIMILLCFCIYYFDILKEPAPRRTKDYVAINNAMFNIQETNSTAMLWQLKHSASFAGLKQKKRKKRDAPQPENYAVHNYMLVTNKMNEVLKEIGAQDVIGYEIALSTKREIMLDLSCNLTKPEI